MRFPVLAALAMATALPAHAAMISRIGDQDICQIMSGIAGVASEARQSGMSQQQAARELSGVIGQALSNGPGDAASRQRTASIIGGEATNILRLVYSMPVGRSAAERAQWVQSGEEYVWQYCMGYAD